MAASKPVEPQSGTGLPRWQLALLVGAPIVLGVGAVYLWNRSRTKEKKGTGERKTPEGSASPVQGQDGESRSGREQESMSPLDRAQASKNKGNKYFKAGKYENAIQCYTEAIALCPTEQKSDLSTFYQNRAAAYEQQMKWTEVVQDCSKAVELNPRYVKALFRRAKALERLENRKECLEDVTAVCILEAFQNQQSMLLADKVLKQLGKEKAKEKYKCLCHLSFSFDSSVLQYRQAYTGSNISQIQTAMDGFEDVIRRFPKCAEGYALYAQALTDQQQFGKADEMYDKCIELEPDNATTYVHKGLLQLQWKQDLDLGLDLISKAIEIDNKCDFAYETMGTIEVQRGNLDKAIEMFNKAINLAKSEMEMAHLYSLCDAAYAQTEVARKYGLKPPTL
ncbi:mitochondrial import receptor subunit TOM70 [Pundamilia nyererei]|uniref:Mitochondrial import receptor subunit TOM70 n=1 Tax=Pundamilia nyererei TaxID=303518 RepID=A0A9Y3REC2_9CICH|nr:PREDICTED: mitochondrial import receptor subunit TOM70 [Pundamilia nyererei]